MNIIKAIEEIPADTPKADLPDLLDPILREAANLDPAKAEACLSRMQFRFALRREDISAYRKMLRGFQKEAEEESRKSAPKTIMNITFPGLIDVAELNGKPVFLLMNGDRVEALESVDRDGVRYIPPPKEQLPWMLPRADEVLRWYEGDRDEALYEDLLTYHKAISELPSEAHYDLIVAWDFHTHLPESLQYSPIMWLYAVPERGKSRTGKGIIYVARRGIHVESLREAYFLRMAQDLQATMFIDVMDLWKKAERSGSEDILLLRFERGPKVARVLYPDKGPHQDTVYYSVFGSTIIGTNENIHPILETRSLPLTLQQSKRSFDLEVTEELGRPFRERLTGFRARHMHVSLPKMDKPLKGRLGDISKPLLQFVRMVHPKREPVLRDLIQQLEHERHMQKSESFEGEVLLALDTLRHRVENGLLPVKEVTEFLNEGRIKHVTPQKVGCTLKALGFAKKDTSQKTKAIVWDEDHLAREMVSYGLQNSPNSPKSPGALQDNELQAGEFPETSGDSPQSLLPVNQRKTTESRESGEFGDFSHSSGEDARFRVVASELLEEKVVVLEDAQFEAEARRAHPDLVIYTPKEIRHLWALREEPDFRETVKRVHLAKKQLGGFVEGHA